MHFHSAKPNPHALSPARACRNNQCHQFRSSSSKLDSGKFPTFAIFAAQIFIRFYDIGEFRVG